MLLCRTVDEFDLRLIRYQHHKLLNTSDADTIDTLATTIVNSSAMDTLRSDSALIMMGVTATIEDERVVLNRLVLDKKIALDAG